MSEGSGKPQSPAIRHLPALSGIVTIVLLLSVVIRVTLRDELPVLRVLFYALPKPILATALLGVAVWWLTRKRWSLGALLLLLGLFFVFTWRSQDFVASDSAETNLDTSAVRVVFWNCARPESPREVEALARKLMGHDPDIVLLVETRGEKSRFEETWRSTLSPLQVQSLPMGLMVASRWPLRVVDWEMIGRRTRVTGMQAQTHQGLLRLVLSDVDGNPFLSREAAYQATLAVAASAAEPVLVAGDFNTPLDSVYPEILERGGLSNAFETFSGGYAPTWPVGAPLMMLDQVWTRDLEVVSFEKFDTRLSDHQLLVVDVVPTE